MTLKQTHGRALGTVALICAAAMALHAVLSEVLRDTVMAATGLISAEAAQASAATLPWALAAYWLGFAAFIGMALCLALLDIRHIRSHYAAGKREILKRTLHERSFRKSLRASVAPGKKLDSSRDGT